MDNPCPQCGFTIGVRGWSCGVCRARWWIGAVVIPVTPRPFLDLLTAAVELGAMRAVLADLLALAEQAPGLSGEQVRARLMGLARELGGEIR